MPEQNFLELSSKFERVDKAYANFINLNNRLLQLGIDQTDLAKDLDEIMEKFKKIQTIASTEMEQLKVDNKEFEQGNIGLAQFAKRLAISTSKVADVTFDLDTTVSPRLLRLSKKIAEPVIEGAKSIQQEHPVIAQEAKILENKMSEVSNETDVVDRIDKTLSLFDKAIELGKKIYPVVKKYAPAVLPKLALLAGLFA